MVELGKVGEKRKKIAASAKQTAPITTMDTSQQRPMIEEKRELRVDKLEFLEKTLTEVTGQVVQLQLELEVSRS